MTHIIGIESKAMARLKTVAFVVGDAVVFGLSLLLTLWLRYGEVTEASVRLHAWPFGLGLLGLVFLFFVGGLYDRRPLRLPEFTRKFFSLTLLSAVGITTLLYFVPAFGIAPKANLFIFIALFLIIGFFWRSLFNRYVVSLVAPQRVLIVGGNKSITEINEYISANSQLGYQVVDIVPTVSDVPATLKKVIDGNISIVLISAQVASSENVSRFAYEATLHGAVVTTVAGFYETLFDRASIADFDGAIPLAQFTARHRLYQAWKYCVEFLLALLLFVILLPFMIIAGALVVLTSQGPMIYSQRGIVGQRRAGRRGKIFHLYKFRSMYHTADKNPDAHGDTPTWSSTTDNRVTPIGRILRASHVDEFPQLLNVLKGEMSFIGPRPERPEFVEQLEKEIPFYRLRLLVKPGITGWAQINYPYGASVEGAYRKLQYELYYLKHRSLWLDIAILIKTVKHFFIKSEKK